MGWGVDSGPYILLQGLNLAFQGGIYQRIPSGEFYQGVPSGGFIRDFLQGDLSVFVGAPPTGVEGPGLFSPFLSGHFGHDVPTHLK